MIEHHIVSRDDTLYEAFPDVALTASGDLVCVFAECTHHRDRSYTRIMMARSSDRGRTWEPKRPITAALRGVNRVDPFWNCPRITALSDGSLIVAVDRVAGRDSANLGGEQSNWLLRSADEGATWSEPVLTPAYGIVPDRVIECRTGPRPGRLLLGAHTILGTAEAPSWQERCWLSDDGGATWQGPQVIAAVEGLQLCEGSIVELPGGELVCFMRENSGLGLDAFKAISRDGGETWGETVPFPLPGCHRPVAGMLASDKVLITHRFMQGGQGWAGWWTQNLFAGLTDVPSCLAPSRNEAHTRIMPLQFDRSPESDTGYSGWVQFDDGEIYVVNYCLDDAPKGQIRACSFHEEDMVL